jgi:outer membrane protein assembly factor BamB
VLFAVASLTAALACNHDPTDADDAGVRMRWRFPQAGKSSARPAVVDNVAYFGSGDGRLIARDRYTGVERWSTLISDTPTAVRGSNIVARGGVVVAPIGAFSVGVDATTGMLLWRYEAPPDVVGFGLQGGPGSVIRSRIDADEEYAYIPAWGASISAVNLRTGALRWTWKPGRASSDTSAAGVFASGSNGVRLTGDTLFATVWHFVEPLGARAEAWLLALDAKTGAELWRYVQPTYAQAVMVQGAPAFFRNLVIFATTGGRVTAVDRTTHDVAWTFVNPQAKYMTSTQVEVFDGTVYADGGDERLYALNASTGAVVWSAPTFAADLDLLVTSKRVYSINGGKIRIVDRATGRIVSVVSVSNEYDAVESPATFAGGRVFVTVPGAAWSYDEP